MEKTLDYANTLCPSASTGSRLQQGERLEKEVPTTWYRKLKEWKSGCVENLGEERTLQEPVFLASRWVPNEGNNC